jgi:hypothetical protein
MLKCKMSIKLFVLNCVFLCCGGGGGGGGGGVSAGIAVRLHADIPNPACHPTFLWRRI